MILVQKKKKIRCYSATTWKIVARKKGRGKTSNFCRTEESQKKSWIKATLLQYIITEEKNCKINGETSACFEK